MLDMTRAYGLNLLFPEGDDSVGRALCDYGEFAPAELGLIVEYLNKAGRGGTFIDVGANIGAITLPIARGRDSWRFIAVEGHRGLAQVLSANALSNGLYNVEVLNAAVSDQAGLIDFPAIPLTSSGNFGIAGLHMDKAFKNERVRACTIDEIAPETTRFVKVDVEGHESAVLRGATATLEKVRPSWLLEASPKNEVSNREVREILTSADYDLYWFFSPFVTLGRTRKRSSKPTPRTGDAGIVALPHGTANLWSLPAIKSADEPWPHETKSYGYLKNYGY